MTSRAAAAVPKPIVTRTRPPTTQKLSGVVILTVAEADVGAPSAPMDASVTVCSPTWNPFGIGRDEDRVGLDDEIGHRARLEPLGDDSQRGSSVQRRSVEFAHPDLRSRRYRQDLELTRSSSFDWPLGVLGVRELYECRSHRPIPVRIRVKLLAHLALGGSGSSGVDPHTQQDPQGAAHELLRRDDADVAQVEVVQVLVGVARRVCRLERVP
jgi:hypothetical protein